MTVRVIPITGRGSRAAEITWTADDDQRGRIADLTVSERLADALSALGATPGQPVADDTQALAVIARNTHSLARSLERCTAELVVQLRDKRSLSWPEIAYQILGDREKHSSIRRMYESGRRSRGA